MFKVQAERCGKCNERVYFNERVYALQKPWHKSCFRCEDCKKVISLGSQFDNGGDPYCQKCYQKNFGPRGFRGGSFGSMVAGNFDGKTPVVSPSVQWKQRNSIDMGATVSSSIRDKLESKDVATDSVVDVEKAPEEEALSVDEPYVPPSPVSIKLPSQPESVKSSLKVGAVVRSESMDVADERPKIETVSRGVQTDDILPPPAKAEIEEALEKEEKAQAKLALEQLTKEDADDYASDQSEEADEAAPNVAENTPGQRSSLTAFMRSGSYTEAVDYVQKSLRGFFGKQN